MMSSVVFGKSLSEVVMIANLTAMCNDSQLVKADKNTRLLWQRIGVANIGLWYLTARPDGGWHGLYIRYWDGWKQWLPIGWQEDEWLRTVSNEDG